MPFSLDPCPTPAKRVCVENNANVALGEQTANNVENKSEPEQDINLIKSLEPFIKYVRWESKDADYFLKNVHGNNIMTEENENAAMSHMLQSFIDNQPLVSVWYEQLIQRKMLAYIILSFSSYFLIFVPV